MRPIFYTVLYKIISLLFLNIVLFLVISPQISLAASPSPTAVSLSTPWWEFQSIDTMKFSRDTSRQFLDNPELARQIIELQVKLVADTGATHVAIATPYDEEFIPILKKWVAEARKHNLKVWYRGNWSGWERWFGYEKISREEHITKTKDFIVAYPDLFEEGDVFSACPECENGGPGDPRRTGDVVAYRQFLIDEYQAMNESFRSIGKNIRSNYIPMNGDVAKLVMDEETTKKMGGIVTIDHYVSTPRKLIDDIEEIAAKSKGKVVLGEFGAPIPDIHGNYTESQQAEWIEEALAFVALSPDVVGLNYWTGFGGSTEIWYQDGTPKRAVAVLEKYFRPQILSGSVTTQKQKPIEGAQVWSLEKKVFTDENGGFILPFIEKKGNILITAPGYSDEVVAFNEIAETENLQIILEKDGSTFFSSIQAFWRNLINFFK